MSVAAERYSVDSCALQKQSGLQKLALYIASTVYLRPGQVFSRLRLLLHHNVLHGSRTYTARYVRLATGNEPVTPLVFPHGTYHSTNLDGISDGTFTFLNRRVWLGQPINWFPQHETRLWLYNLHYFDYALALGWEYAQHGNTQAYHVFRRLVSDWIVGCPVGTPIAWDAYPTSLRLSNWIKAYTLFAPALLAESSFAKELRRSLYMQAAFLENHLEYHLLNNHLLENGRALMLAGCFFVDRHADHWRCKGQRLLWRGLAEQFLADGGHDERSPMYHQIMLNLYQDIASVLEGKGDVVPPELTQRLHAMRHWLSAVLHPDGKIALLNDAAFGIAGDPQHAIGGAMAVCDGLTVLPDSGYAIFRDRRQQHFLIFDCGPMGPDHQPAHGHCDALSYEFSLAGQRMIVDSGVGTYYGDLAWRTYYRSTRAHNTLVVDGAEQSEIWDHFRVARRARPFDVAWVDQGRDLAYIAGAHSGYRRLRGNVVHRRWICWIDRRFWVVCDRLTGRGVHHVESLIHFHPDVHVVAVPTSSAQTWSGEVRRGPVTLKIVPWGLQNVSTYFGETTPIQGWYAPEFGVALKNPVWGFSQVHALPIWTGYVLWPEATDVTVQLSPVDENSCRLVIQAPEGAYRLVCGPHEVTLEKTICR